MLIRSLALALPAALTAACTNAVPLTAPAGPGVSASPSTWTLYQGSPSPQPFGAESLAPGEADAPSTTASGTFLPYRPGSTAIGYDPTAVPPGAAARLSITTTAYGVVVRLIVAGLVPRRSYGAHLHTQPCTAAPDDAGPHYQHRHDPKAVASPPSVDPAYANPRNEVWLDFTTNATGAGNAVSRQAWVFDRGQAPRSLVLHAERTRTAAGVAGMAGPRVACLTLPAG